ncbi:hypothetical protein Tco_0428883 [Tanacetum coccineum]
MLSTAHLLYTNATQTISPDPVDIVAYSNLSPHNLSQPPNNPIYYIPAPHRLPSQTLDAPPHSPLPHPGTPLPHTIFHDHTPSAPHLKARSLAVPRSGSPITHSELSLPDFKAFYIDNDHFKERSSGSTTTHVDFSQYDSFIFDLSNDQFPPTDRSDLNHEEFADELAHIISPPEYDHFCFKIEPELGNLTMDVVNDIFPTREPRVHVPNVLPTHPTLDTDFILLSEPLFAYIIGFFFHFSRIQLLHHIFSPVGMKTSFLIPASQCIILLCRMYLIGVELS